MGRSFLSKSSFLKGGSVKSNKGEEEVRPALSLISSLQPIRASGVYRWGPGELE